MTDRLQPGTERWVVLLAHGSGDARWRQPFEALRKRVEAAAGGAFGVALAYLQFCWPTLEQALQDCQQVGGRQVLVVPVFMSGGGHLMRDVPQAIEDAARAAPGLQVQASGALAEEAEVAAAMTGAVLRLAGEGRAGDP
jgi:sirohydrochlorin cobaltochelatase